MECSLTTPPFVMPPTLLFTHPSRIANSWCPMPEVVVLPERQVGGGRVTLSVAPGNTKDLGIPFRSRNPRRILARRRTIKLGDRLVFDARFDTDGNVAHQFSSVAVRVLLARRELERELGREVEITVVLRGRATGYAQNLHRRLGLQVLATDSLVEGHLVRVEVGQVDTHERGRMLFSGGTPASLVLTPEVVTSAPLQLEDPGDLPERIYIARRGSRAITNDEEITRLLEGRGYRKFYFEEESYDRQILLCRHARSIVAIHGAAMAYMLLNANGLARPAGDRSGLRVVELFGPGYTVDLYRRYAAVLNAHWCGVRGQITPEVIRDLDQQNQPRSHEKDSFRVDPRSLEMALDFSERAPTTPSGLLEGVV